MRLGSSLPRNQRLGGTPDTFWAKAKDVASSAPAGTRVHVVFPSQDGKTGTCVWEGNSVAEIQNFLDDEVAGIAINFC